MADPAEATSTSAAGSVSAAASALEMTGPPRVYLECTTTVASRYRTGIQRMVRGIVEAALTTPGPWTCVPIVYNGRFFETVDRLPAPQTDGARPAGANAIDVLRRAFHEARASVGRYFPFVPLRAALHSPRLEFYLRRGVNALQNSRRWVGSFRHRGARIAFAPGDVLVLLDSTWSVDMSRELKRVRAGGARIWAVVQDLIPIDHPELAPEGLPMLLEAWLQRTVPLCDGLLAISRTVAGDLSAYLARRFAGRPVPQVHSFYPGAGLDPAMSDAEGLTAVAEAFRSHSASAFIVVGTIEPRKDVGSIIAAFECLWSEGSDAALLLFGRAGWRSYELIDRVRAHPERGRRLFWFERASDAELDFAYRHATALIFASRCEGFGLPLVEAMQYGLPVLASDIPIFREIGGEYPQFFPAGDELALYEAVRRHIEARSSHPATPRTPRAWLSWPDSARTLLDKVTARQRASERRDP